MASTPTSVKNFSSTDPGAMVLSGTAGALSALLKAYLVDGRGAGAVQGLTVANGIATAVYAAGHPFSVGSVGLFAGATPAGLNGEKRILTTATNSVTFAAPGIADGAATGSITSKLAAAGWLQVAAGANILALKSASAEGTGCVLRIDDTGAAAARAIGYESMSDINTGSGPFPSAAMNSGGQYWWKSDSAGVSPRAWRMFADDRLFYLWVAAGGGVQGQGILAVFGDINSAKSGDSWACVINGFSSGSNTSVAQAGCAGFGNAAVAATSEFVIARSHLGVGGAQLAKKLAAHNLGAGYSGTLPYNPNALNYPNGPDNSLRLAPVEVVSGAGIRGVLPGLYHCPQMLAGLFGTGDRVNGTGAFAGRTFCALVVGPSVGSSLTPGVVFLDITDSWR
ncbi:MAG: hypothetical protein RR715_00090 [Comamonas sp.]